MHVNNLPPPLPLCYNGKHRLLQRRKQFTNLKQEKVGPCGTMMLNSNPWLINKRHKYYMKADCRQMFQAYLGVVRGWFGSRSFNGAPVTQNEDLRGEGKFKYITHCHREEVRVWHEGGSGCNLWHVSVEGCVKGKTLFSRSFISAKIQAVIICSWMQFAADLGHLCFIFRLTKFMNNIELVKRV